MKRVFVFLLAWLTLGAFVLAGCQKKETGWQELVVGIGRDTVDPNGGMWESRGLVFETLVTLDQQGEPQPLLAKKWLISADGKEYTFFLQENVKFHDGSRFDARSLKENVDRLRSVWGKYPLDKVEMIGDYSVRFCLTRPYPLFLWHLSQIKDGMIVSPGALKGASGSDVVVAAPVGTGPYRLKEHVAGQSWTMEANEGYWQGDVGIKRIKYLVIPDAHSRVMALESGQIQITGISPLSRIAAGDMQLIEKNKGLVLKHVPSYVVRPLAFNTKKGIMTDPLLREALVKAINREDIDMVLKPGGTTLATPVSPASPYYLKDLEKSGHRRHDLAEATELLKRAGWENKGGNILQKAGRPLQVEFIYSQTEPEMAQIASIIQQQLKAVGVEMRISQIESGALFTVLAKGEYDIIGAPGIGSSSLDFFMDYHSQGKYSVAADGELDKMLEAFNSAVSIEQQKTIGRQIQEKILKDNLALLFINKFRSFAHAAGLQGFEPALEEEVNLMRHIWKARLTGESRG